MSRDLRGLEDDGVTSSNGTNDRTDGEGDGVVPGANDENGTLRFRTDGSAVHGPSSTGPRLGGLGPLVNLADGVYDLVGDTHEFGKDGLKSRTTEILLEGLDESILVVLEHVGERLELVLSVFDGTSLAGQEGGAKVGDHVRDHIDRSVLKAGFSGGSGSHGG